MNYRPSWDVLQTRNKCVRIRSRKTEENHVDMNFHMEDMEHVKDVEKEVKKAIRNLNRLLGKKMSFTITVLSEQSESISEGNVKAGSPAKNQMQVTDSTGHIQEGLDHEWITERLERCKRSVAFYKNKVKLCQKELEEMTKMVNQVIGQ